MKLNIGDILTIDGVEMIVDGQYRTDTYWIRNKDTSNYYHLSPYTIKYLEQLKNEGRLFLGNSLPKTIGGNKLHIHNWKKHIGALKVYDYCDCGAKRYIDWKEIGDVDK